MSDNPSRDRNHRGRVPSNPKQTDKSDTDSREWTCEACGETLVYPETKVLEHYDTAHSEEYSHMIGWYEGKHT